MADNRAACRQGLLEPIDHSLLHPAPDGTPAAGDFVDGALTECGVAQIVYAMVAAYHRDAFPGERPARIRDLFDIHRFPGTRALQRGPEANLEWALRSYGVPRQDLYQLLSTERGLRLAFERLDRIRDHVIWWTSAGEPGEMLVSGEAVIVSEYNGRLFDLAAVQGHPIEIIWDGQVLRARLVGDPAGDAAPRRRSRIHPLRDRDPPARGPGEVHRLRPGPPLVHEARFHARGDGRRHASPPADQPGELPDRDSQGTRSGTRASTTGSRPASTSGSPGDEPRPPGLGPRRRGGRAGGCPDPPGRLATRGWASGLAAPRGGRTWGSLSPASPEPQGRDGAVVVNRGRPSSAPGSPRPGICGPASRARGARPHRGGRRDAKSAAPS